MPIELMPICMTLVITVTDQHEICMAFVMSEKNHLCYNHKTLIPKQESQSYMNVCINVLLNKFNVVDFTK